MSDSGPPEVLWHAEELASLFNLPSFNTDISGISIDSRTVQKGDLFIALTGDPGPRFGGGSGAGLDGHEFVAQAVEKGASAVMIHSDADHGSAEAIRVEDTLDGLWALGQSGRARSRGKIVAITGSSGKTTIRSWLQQLLSSVGNVHASPGSFNNHWGVPLSLARMPRQCDFGIFEIGTNHPGEIGPLSKLARPDVALLLNVLPAHIGNFGGMDELTTEKLSIAEGLNPEGVLVLPAHLAAMADHDRKLGFGESPTADVRLLDAGTPLQISIQGESVTFESPFSEPERIQSLLGIAGVLKALDVDVPKTLAGVARLDLPVGRGNIENRAGITIINDSYNANPASMLMAVNSLGRRQVAGRKIALLGEMLELGAMGEGAHTEVADACSDIDEVITFGEGFGPVSRTLGYRHYTSTADFSIGEFVASLNPGDAILVKGSNRVFWVNGFVSKLIQAVGDQ